MPNSDHEKFDKINAVFQKEIQTVLRYLLLAVLSGFGAPILGFILPIGTSAIFYLYFDLLLPFWIVIPSIFGFCLIFIWVGRRYRLRLEKRINDLTKSIEKKSDTTWILIRNKPSQNGIPGILIDQLRIRRIAVSDGFFPANLSTFVPGCLVPVSVIRPQSRPNSS